MFLLAFVFLLLHVSMINASFTVEPTDVSVVQGETATLRCTVVNPENAIMSWLYWSKGNQHLSINETILPNMGDDVRARYSISGNRSIGEYYLSISNAKPVDQGSYHCSYISSLGGETSISASLTVLVPPEEGFPKCSMHASSDAGGSDMTTIWPGQGVVFSCISRGGDPPAELSWHRGNHSIMDPRPSRITYERILKREDNGITFTCQAHSPALPTPRKCSVMPMKILPIVQVRSMTGQIKPGGNGTYHCEGSAIPRVHTYTWYGFTSDSPIEDNDRFTLTNHNQVLTIHSVDYSENHMELRCDVGIQSGLKASASIKLDVAEPPKPKVTTVRPPVVETANLEETDGGGTITDIRRIITMDVNFVVAIIAGSLVLLLLVVTMIMGCWVCSATSQPRRSNNCPRIEYTEAVPTTIPQSYSMECLNAQNHVLYGDTTSCAVPNSSAALDNENAPGYISALYATLDKNKRPVRTSATLNIPGKPVAQITPNQSCDASEKSCCVSMVRPEKAIPEPVKPSSLVRKVSAVEPVKPVVKPMPEVVKPMAKPVVNASVGPVVKPVVKPVVTPVVKPVVKPPVVAPLPVKAENTPVKGQSSASALSPVSSAEKPAKTKDTKDDEKSVQDSSTSEEDAINGNTKNHTNFDEELD